MLNVINDLRITRTSPQVKPSMIFANINFSFMVVQPGITLPDLVLIALDDGEPWNGENIFGCTVSEVEKKYNMQYIDAATIIIT